MSDPVWYRSLYWRIAFGFIALLAILLLVQGLLFLWLTDRFVGPVRTPAQLAALVASEVAAEVEQHPTVALEEYVRTHFSHIYQPFLWSSRTVSVPRTVRRPCRRTWAA